MDRRFCFIIYIFIFYYNTYAVDCADPRCTKEYTDLLGRCICMEWTGESNTEPAENNLYVNDIGDIILVVDGEEHVQLMGIDTSKINSNHENLVISFAGAGIESGGETPEKVMETITYGDNLPDSETHGDAIYKKALEFIDKKTVAVIGYPWFYLYDGSIPDTDEFFKPNPNLFADRIEMALNKMSAKRKLILIGKSMGGCKLLKVAQVLNTRNIKVDLLIIVDGSCIYYDQHYAIFTKSIQTNVKKMYNFHQTTPYPDNNRQNGFLVSFSYPTIGYNIDVTETNEYSNTIMCPGVGHNDIDECDNIQYEITKIVNREIINNNLIPIIKLLLND